jgi:poly(3-hydroxybutyrate) depolymerase
MKPMVFDSNKRYPVIVSLHGGGGRGTDNLIQTDPDYFAAAAPSAGTGLPETEDFIDASLMKDVPIWSFHGDADITCWDFMLGRTGSQAMFSIGPDQSILYSPKAQTLRLIRSMPTRRVFSQADDGIRILASVSDTRAGDSDDRAALLLWSNQEMPAPVDVHLSISNNFLPAH